MYTLIVGMKMKSTFYKLMVIVSILMVMKIMYTIIEARTTKEFCILITMINPVCFLVVIPRLVCTLTTQILNIPKVVYILTTTLRPLHLTILKMTPHIFKPMTYFLPAILLVLHNLWTVVTRVTISTTWLSLAMTTPSWRHHQIFHHQPRHR